MAETSPIELCFICDDGYVMPTAVAIQSLKENGTGGRRCRVHIVAADLSEESEAVLRGMSDGEMSVTVVRASAQELASLHVPQEGGMCVATPAALLKFSLGELLPDLDKVLYLDGDILVRKNLAPIFDLDLGEKVLAAAPDTGVISFPRPIHAEVKRYFNSGVMLLNLKKMRAEDYAARLVAAKRGTRLNWTDAEGKPTTRRKISHSASGIFWIDGGGIAATNGTNKPDAEQKKAEQSMANTKEREAFFAAALAVAAEAGDNLLDADTFKRRLIEKPGGAIAKSTRSANFVQRWNEAKADGGILRTQYKLERKPNGAVGNTKARTMLVSTPDRIAKYLDQFNSLGL